MSSVRKDTANFLANIIKKVGPADSSPDDQRCS